ncbi:uncharacterized protein LOC129276190 [Lytechinus pictus]|uniref:uncharacterized protein LOC129276190 n=1 Tax=Lytechinus pictus TaxID=7653 RepID=UPI0030BA1685
MIEQVHSLKYLGVTLNSSVTWDDQVDNGKRSPQITIKQIRVRIEPDKKGKRAPKGVTKQIRAQPNRLSLRQRQEREAETSFITVPQTSTRTNSALLEIGTCTTDVVLGKGMVSTLKGDSFTSETELLESLDQQKIKHRDNEYDNPIMNLKDPDEDIDMIKNARRTSTETDTPFTSDTSNVPSWNNSPLHFISGRTVRRASSPERTSLSGANAERDTVFRESSESGSNGEVHRRIKLMRMHGRRNSGNNSKDSGYAGGSFASNDSSRNLLAYRDLREDLQKRENPNLGVMKDVDNTRDTTPVIFEMESETAPLVRLNSTRPLNPQQPRRYSLQVPPQPSLYHANVTRNNSHPYYPQVRPVRRIVGSSVRGRRNPLPFYPRDIPRHERYNEYPYIVDCPPLYYEDSYLNFNEPLEHPARIPRRTNNPLYRLPPQDNQQYSPNLFPSLSSFPVTPQLHQVPHDQMQFVKRRTTSTQTPTDYSPDTPPASPPSAPSIIRWHREGRSFVIMPREDMALDYLGPIYLAESMSESDQSLDEPTGIAIASDSDATRPPQQPREGRATNSETDSDQLDRSDSNDDEESTKTSSKDEDSIKDEKALLLEAKSDWIHDTQL